MADPSSAVDVWNTVGTYLNTMVTAGLAVAIYRVTKRDEIGRLKAVLDSERESRRDERMYAHRVSAFQDAIGYFHQIPVTLAASYISWEDGEVTKALAGGRSLVEIQGQLINESLKMQDVPQLADDVFHAGQAAADAGVLLGELAKRDAKPIQSWCDDFENYRDSVFASAVVVRQRLLDYVASGEAPEESVVSQDLHRSPGAPVYPSLGE